MIRAPDGRTTSRKAGRDWGRTIVEKVASASRAPHPSGSGISKFPSLRGPQPWRRWGCPSGEPSGKRQRWTQRGRGCEVLGVHWERRGSRRESGAGGGGRRSREEGLGAVARPLPSPRVRSFPFPSRAGHPSASRRGQAAAGGGANTSRLRAPDLAVTGDRGGDGDVARACDEVRKWGVAY